MSENKDFVFKCEMPYYPYSHHLSQVYSGFELLRKKNIVDVHYTGKETFQPYNKINILKIRVNDKYDVVYDLFDSVDWLIGESPEKNYKYYIENLQSDFYFKRSYNKEFYNRIADKTKIFTFGFNYPINNKNLLKFKIGDIIKKNINYPVFHKLLNFNNISLKDTDFEQYPIRNRQNKILFLTRLWDPNPTNEILESKEVQLEREEINLSRVNCIKACKKEFGDLFEGGVQSTEFSMKYFKELIQPRYLTDRKNYLKKVKDSNICIATTGLHGSTGWKFGEYVAASRAIISEPLNFEVAGKFNKNTNYLEFNNPEDLIKNIQFLLNNEDEIQKMMIENFKYYQNYLRPDILILNTLLQIL